MSFIVKKAPESIEDISDDHVRIFLAGSIDMGDAEEWQSKITNDIKEKSSVKDIAILNPRRDDWDSSWEQSIDNKQFKEQVEWELNAMENSDIIVYYFDKNGEAPITLMELGLHAKRGVDDDNHKQSVVCCPDGYWKRGNVEVTCDFYEIPFFDDYDEMVSALCG